jgi:hypothetical protein
MATNVLMFDKVIADIIIRNVRMAVIADFYKLDRATIIMIKIILD